jgi:hypothetical protein
MSEVAKTNGVPTDMVVAALILTAAAAVGRPAAVVAPQASM